MSFPKSSKYPTDGLREKRYNGYQNTVCSILSKKYNNTSSKSDKRIYKEIKKIFASPSLMYYLIEMDLSNDFDDSVFYPLNRIIKLRDDSDYQFKNAQIERYKRKLFSSVINFLKYKSLNTYPNDIGTRAIYTWENDKYSIREREHINMEFNGLATAVGDSYKEFVKVCKRNLN